MYNIHIFEKMYLSKPCGYVKLDKYQSKATLK